MDTAIFQTEIIPSKVERHIRQLEQTGFVRPNLPIKSPLAEKVLQSFSASDFESLPNFLRVAIGKGVQVLEAERLAKGRELGGLAVVGDQTTAVSSDSIDMKE